MDGEVGGGERAIIFNSPPLPLSLFLTDNHSFGTDFFLSPASLAIKVKDGGYNFR